MLKEKWVTIEEKRADSIMSVFQQRQGKSLVRGIFKYNDLVWIMKEIDNRLDNMPKTKKEGTEVIYNFRQHFPGAYKYSPDSTHFKMRFHSGKWQIDLSTITRTACPNLSSNYQYAMYLSDSAKEWILSQYT